MKTVFKLFGILDSDYQDLPHREQGLLSMAIPATFFSGITAGSIIGYCIQFFLESIYLSIGIGFLSGLLFTMHNKTLFSSLKTRVITFVLIVSFLFASVVSLPFKFLLQYDELESLYLESNLQKLKDADALAEAQIAELYNKKDRLLNERQNAAGKVKETWQPLVTSRKNIEAFMDDLEERKDRIRKQAIAQTGYNDNLKLSKFQLFSFYIDETFDGEMDSELLMFLIYFFMFCLLEGAPGLIALGLKGGVYEQKIRQREKARKVLDEKRRNIQMNIIEDSANIPTLLSELELNKSLKGALKTDFNDHDEILENHYTVQSRNYESTEGYSTSNDIGDGIPRQKSKESTLVEDIPSFDYESPEL